jgi:hypothetical protein
MAVFCILFWIVPPGLANSPAALQVSRERRLVHVVLGSAIIEFRLHQRAPHQQAQPLTYTIHLPQETPTGPAD